MSEWKWIKFDRTYIAPSKPVNEDGMHEVTISFYCSAFPAIDPTQTCSFCLEPNTRLQFCEEHSLHHNGIICYLYDKTETIIQDWSPTRTLNRSDWRDYITYKVELKKDNMPDCPVCRRRPIQNDVRVSIKDKFRGSFKKIEASVRYK